MKFHQFRIENKNSSPGEYQISRNIEGKGSNRSALFEYGLASSWENPTRCAFLRTINDALSTSMLRFSLIRSIVTIFSIETYNLFFSFLFFFFFVSRGGRISPRIKVKRSLVKTPLPLSIPEGEEKREKVRRENFSGFCLPARRWDFFATSPPPS